ncbi:MAG: transcriptional regulator NrdR [Paracoccaceae bacterium]|nr:transcriptional regulator NrdR [Paracoccaceae bacterium]MCY3726126.1 transcriptional regulator NrdR [Paracoccaceae bacterium]MDE2675424.1 transcriptional regulator NrdR [Paracoccaceae bacterium]MDE2738809.1 transcriptional regulator NrdR [Paracoccaceae bacterium]MDE2760786.1 transcriptional regulator NrdR [Paracoccaceae bacterium]
MRCPYCNNPNTQVTDSRPVENETATRRRRLCKTCGGKWTTYERVQFQDFTVRKTSGDFQDFDRSKLRRSITLALRKRPLERDKIDQLVSGVIRRLEQRGEKEISTNLIGEYVMDSLATIDQVAHIRFASVYKDFQDTDDFVSFITKIRPSNEF